MQTKIISRTTAKGITSFYITSAHKQYFLFTQAYRRSVQDFYGHAGICLDRALDPSFAHNNSALLRTMRKLPSYIKYVEKEQGIIFLDVTRRKQQKRKKIGKMDLLEAC